jgi:hypothetical protein
LLETVIGPQPAIDSGAAWEKSAGFSLRGDLEVWLSLAGQLRRTYKTLPLRWLGELIQAAPRRIAPQSVP